MGMGTGTGTGYLHSGQASDLGGRNGWPRILQHTSEMFVADLVLPSGRNDD